MHAEKRAVYGDCRDDLPELSEKHKERIGGAVVTTSRFYLDIVDCVGCH